MYLVLGNDGSYKIVILNDSEKKLRRIENTVY